MASYQNMIDAVAEEQGVETKEARNILDYVFKYIQGTLAMKEDVTTPIGKFKPTHRDARMGRNPHSGEAIKIKASNGAKFTSNKALKDALN